MPSVTNCSREAFLVPFCQCASGRLPAGCRPRSRSDRACHRAPRSAHHPDAVYRRLTAPTGSQRHDEQHRPVDHRPPGGPGPGRQRRPGPRRRSDSRNRRRPFTAGQPDTAASYTTLINPGRAIPRRPWISPGLTTAVLAAAPAPADVEPELAHRINGRIVVGHNIRLDWRLLTAAIPPSPPPGSSIPSAWPATSNSAPKTASARSSPSSNSPIRQNASRPAVSRTGHYGTPSPPRSSCPPSSPRNGPTVPPSPNCSTSPPSTPRPPARPRPARQPCSDPCAQALTRTVIWEMSGG